MELDQIISAVQSRLPRSTDSQIIDAIDDSGIDASLYTPAHVDALVQRLNPAPLATGQTTVTKAKQSAPQQPKSGKLAKSQSNKLADRSPVAAEVPTFAATQQEDLGLAQVEADGYAVGYGDIASVMATARRGYALGAQDAFTEGAIESSSFRQQVLASAVGAMFGGGS